MKCIAIDDEPMAIEILEEYIQKVPFLEHNGSYRDALSALETIQQKEVDLLFLDINMPDLSGIDFLKSLPNKDVMVIFCTAYSEYALQSYDFDAVDYLLKPIDFDRFLKATLKAKKQYEYKPGSRQPGQTLTVNAKQQEKDYILVKTGSDIAKVNLGEIQYLKATGNYVNIVTLNKEILTLIPMKELLTQLPSENFIRIHKSFVISFAFVDRVEKHQVQIGKQKIPIGNIYRKEFFDWLKNNE